MSSLRDGDLTVSVFNNPKIPQVRWSSGTGGHPGALLLVQGDGNMIIISHQGQLLWASNTAGLKPCDKRTRQADTRFDTPAQSGVSSFRNSLRQLGFARFASPLH